MDTKAKGKVDRPGVSLSGVGCVLSCLMSIWQQDISISSPDKSHCRRATLTSSQQGAGSGMQPFASFSHRVLSMRQAAYLNLNQPGCGGSCL
jgi:hypothetical protein